MTDSITGDVAAGFESVRETFAEIHAKKWDIGSGFSAYLHGKKIIDLYGGIRDPRASRPLPYDSQTVQLIASASKFAESIGIALLVDRGLLSYDDTLVKYWPEFASGDSRKAKITVRQLMMHRAGLAAMDAQLSDTLLFDQEALSHFLEKQKIETTLYSTESTSGNWRTQALPQAYHAVSRGLYASQLLRRVDKQA